MAKEARVENLNAQYILLCNISPEVELPVASALCDPTPGDTSLVSGEVFENAQTGLVATTVGLEGSVGAITLSLLGDLSTYFEVDGKEIKVKDGKALDRTNLANPSRAEEITITGFVECRITGATSGTNYAASIDMKYINKYNPIIISANSTDQSEYVAVGADIPFSIAAGTEGSGDPLTEINVFEILSQVPANVFTISADGQLKLAKDLDYAKYKTHTIDLLVKNTGPDSMGNDTTLTATKTITINIQDYDDLPPVFQPCVKEVCQPLYSLNINVGQSTGSLNVEPGPIEAKDGDIGINQTIEYSFISGTPADYVTYLDINSGTGEVTLIAPITSPTTYTIAVKAQQTDRGDRFAVTYLQAIATAKDVHPPTFSETSYSGGVVNDGSDILFVYKTGSTDLLQLVATDGDDANATIIFTTKDPTPYQISSEGYIFVRSSQLSTTRSTSSDLEIVAVNVYADTTSSNRESAPITVNIAVTEVTTQQTTEGTTEPITTEASTTVEPTTPVATTIPTTEPTTTFIDTTTVEPTTPAVTTVPTTEPTTFIDSTTLLATTPEPTTVPTTVATTTVTDTTIQESTTAPVTSTVEITTVPESTTKELTTAPTSTIDSTTQTDFTTSTISADTSPEVTTTSPQTTDSDVSTQSTATKAILSSTSPAAPTGPTTSITPETTSIEVEITSTSVSGATETTKNLEETTRDGFTNEVSMVPASTLYGVAAGLSVALFIAILAIIYLIWRLMKKDKDSKFDDDDEDNVSTSINGNAHMYENGAFTEHETSKEIDERPPPMMVTFTGNPPIIEPGEERDNINEETGSNHSSEADLLGNETEAMDFSAPQDPEYATVNKEENTEILEEEPFGYDNMAEPDTAPKSDFEEELMQRQRQMVAPAVPVAAVLLNESMEDDVDPISDQERKNFRLSPEKIQEERIIKEDAVTTVKLVTLKGYGDDNGDVKAVLKSIDLSMATGTEEQSVRSQIATMEKLGELDHENILTYYGSYEKDGYLHYATKYAENGCLQDKLRNSNVDANTRMHIMADIGRGLQYLHANNIVHGKLWGKSIMLDANNKPKLTDFQNDDSIVTDYGDMMRWQALEVNEQTSGRTAVSDVWSYGTVMWEIVSDGAVPYDGVPVFDLPTHMRENQLPKPKACSDSLFSIMTTCWNTDPKMRPDMYVINSNLSEKLLEDSNNLIGSQTSVRSSSSLSTRLFGDNKVRPDWSDHESNPSPGPPVARTTSAWV
uniref:mucin-17-like n=1 Tax=Styela clava TaxID=7725 RepID=UPI0019398BA0|nr:mucin-17-like [Styela clava]